MNVFRSLNPFRKKRRSETLSAGLLRSTTPSERAHDHFNSGMMDVSNNALITEAERARLRSWCKKEYLDNPYARNAARNFALGVYGTGPTIQINTPNEVLNDKIEKLFKKWRKKTKFDWKVFTALQSLFYDGEAFFMFYGSPGVPGGMNLELIEARRIRDPFAVGMDENRLEGITYNEFNEPCYYSVAVETLNPNAGYAETFTEVPSDLMMHFFLDDVVNQRRGLPMLQSVLETLASLQRIGRASLGAWELAAKMNLVIQTGMDAYDMLKVMPEGAECDGEDRFKAFTTREIPKDGGMTFLANGMEMKQVTAEHPTSAFHENKMTYLSEIGAGVGEPRNIITGDSSAYNFSSAQLDQQMFERWGGTCQGKLCEILDRSLGAAVSSMADYDADAAALLEQYAPDEIPCEWHFANVLEKIDRVNNASSECLLLQNGLMTRKEYCKRHGLDYDKHMAQIREEQNALKQNGDAQSDADSNSGQSAASGGVEPSGGIGDAGAENPAEH